MIASASRARRWRCRSGQACARYRRGRRRAAACTCRADNNRGRAGPCRPGRRRSGVHRRIVRIAEACRARTMSLRNRTGSRPFSARIRPWSDRRRPASRSAFSGAGVELLEPRLVHVARVERAQLAVLGRAGDDRPQLLLVAVVELGPDAVLRLVGGDRVGVQPLAAGIALEIVAGLDRRGRGWRCRRPRFRSGRAGALAVAGVSAAASGAIARQRRRMPPANSRSSNRANPRTLQRS